MGLSGEKPNSGIQGSGSRIQVLDPGSRVLDPGFRIQGPGSQIQNPGSRILDPKSRILEPGSWAQDQDPEFLFSGEATATVGIMYLD